MDSRIRLAIQSDVDRITEIYNQAVEDGLANLDKKKKSVEEMTKWLKTHCCDFPVLVAEINKKVEGFVALYPFMSHCCDTGVVELSIYVDRAKRGEGIGTQLLTDIVDTARVMKYHKIILQVLESNEKAIKIYSKMGFDKVGTFKEHGYINDKWINVTVMEKILTNHHFNVNTKPAIFKI